MAYGISQFLILHCVFIDNVITSGVIQEFMQKINQLNESLRESLNVKEQKIKQLNESLNVKDEKTSQLSQRIDKIESMCTQFRFSKILFGWAG